MKHIWAPWRIEFIRMEKSGGCILCEKPKQNDDAANYILYRGKNNFVILNSFPYNPGHLMIAPYRHVATPEDLTRDDLIEHSEMIIKTLKILREEFEPAGFNLGMNLGKIAGAGIDQHIHTHIVPRWQGDTNFMPVMADVRVLPEALSESYRRLKSRF